MLLASLKGSINFGAKLRIFQVNIVCEIKLIYSEKVTKFCKISTVDLTGIVEDKSKMEISQNFLDFSEYMNFTQSSLLY